MKLIKNKDRSRLTRAALGKIPCDLSIDNVQLVNVLTGEIYPAGVDILDGVVVRVRMHGESCQPAARESVDGQGNYLLPGFIDVHMHVESTMMVPENFGKAAVVWGTTTAVTDPHEIANVMGIPGVEYMLESARRSPLRIFTLAPSCVPAVPTFPLLFPLLSAISPSSPLLTARRDASSSIMHPCVELYRCGCERTPSPLAPRISAGRDSRAPHVPRERRPFRPDLPRASAHPPANPSVSVPNSRPRLHITPPFGRRLYNRHYGT